MLQPFFKLKDSKQNIILKCILIFSSVILISNLMINADAKPARVPANIARLSAVLLNAKNKLKISASKRNLKQIDEKLMFDDTANKDAGNVNFESKQNNNNNNLNNMNEEDNTIKDMTMSHVDECLLACGECYAHELTDQNIEDINQETSLECANYCLSVESPEILHDNVLLEQLIGKYEFASCLNNLWRQIHDHYKSY